MTLVLNADRAESRFKFDILTNAFALLNVPIDASREVVATAFDDAISDGIASDSELREARKRLLAPKSRLAATVEFLPDASDAQRGAAIYALRTGAPLSDLIAIARTLPPVSRSGLLSNIAQVWPSSGLLRYFALSLAEIDPSDLTEDLASISDQAGVPSPTKGAVDEALASANTAATHRLFSGYPHAQAASADLQRCLAEGMPKATAGQLVAYTSVVIAYEKSSASTMLVLRRRVEELAEQLRASPDDGRHAMSLGSALRDWNGLAQPAQILAETKGRDDPASRDLFDNLRSVMLEISNDHDHPASSLEIATLCREVFASLPRARQQLDEDIATLQDLVEQAGVKDLGKLVEQAKANLTSLAAEVRRGGFSSSAPGMAGRLFALFDQSVVATRGTSAAQYAWGLVRILALDINNNLDDGVAAEKIIAALHSHPDFSRAPSATRSSIDADFTTLKSNAAQARFKQAMDRKDRSAARIALTDLVALSTDPTEKTEYQKAINAIDAANTSRIVKFVIWGAIIVGIIVVASSQNGRSSSSIYTAPPTESFSNSGPPGVAKTIDTFEEEKPRVGTSIAFSRANVRYCLYLNARLDTINAAVSTETSQGVVDAFNREVDDYNLRCGSFKYYPDDLAAVTSEVNLKKSTLAAQGRQMLQRWRLAN